MFSLCTCVTDHTDFGDLFSYQRDRLVNTLSDKDFEKHQGAFGRIFQQYF
jgi:hypothetical protein